ncbi:MAG: lycopene beta-cyclase CrtY, partial [Pseudomonadota bacterium]
PHLNLGYQKFIGQEIVLKEPHGETLPTIMDASVSQLDGYRFVYVLPFDEKTVLVEDTRYTDEADLDEGDYRTGISRYIGERGWRIERVEREETGILPVVLAFDGLKFWNERKESAAPIGLRAALFHPTTGYSFPDAVQTADLIADMPQLTSEALREQLRRYGLQQWGDHRFFRLLNRMLFKAAEPEQRYKVLERFYRLSQRLIERFYAGRLRETDKARILFGKPPVPITRAVKVLSPNSIKSTNERNSYVGT